MAGVFVRNVLSLTCRPLPFGVYYPAAHSMGAIPVSHRLSPAV